MSLFKLLGGAGSIATGYKLAKDIKNLGGEARTDLTNLGNELNTDSQFKGYGLTTAMGQTNVDAAGNTALGVARDAGMIANQDQSQLNAQGFNDQAALAAQNAMADPAMREQSIYDRAMAMQNPMLDQQQAQQQAREFAMGRGGVMGSQFGGTAEDAAMARARAQASNAAAFQAMNQGQAEMMNQANMAGQFGQMGNQYGQLANQQFGLGYLPIEQQLNAMQIAGANADRFQTGQFTGNDYKAQLGLGGIQADINANKVGSELYANLAGAGLSAIGNIQSSGKTSGGLFGSISGALGL